MPQVESWDYNNRRYYLSFDTVTNGVDFAAAYLEERAYRAASGENVRGKRPMLRGDGFVSKGGNRRTERFVSHLNGARPVPYDTSHTLTMLVEPITVENNPANALSGADVFDRSPLSPSTNVNIDVGYAQVEVITVSSGSGLDATQANQLATAATNSATLLNRWPEVLATALAKLARRIGIGATARHTKTSISTGSESYTITENGEDDYSISEDNA